ncbi:Transcriptional regulatory protein RCO1 [Labeo rohita]|uniref:Transcriptional regulatory protein RCO1 n=1 Tax=Labeo rohita TaxID=84645 RepID=A0ABQ8M065_LABRO|nr:Transcriptional regulatory protein RCO1 [Labeo rohita]
MGVDIDKWKNTVSEAISLKEKMDNIVKENVGKKQERRHRVATQALFSVGRKVLRKNIRTQQRKGGKLERSWLGPYEIVFLKDKSADLRDEKGHIYPKINTDHLKLFKEEPPPGLLLDEPQLKRREETSPSPVDITITKEEQPPPSPPSSPTAPKLSPRVSPKSSSSLSPLDLSMPLSSPVSHPTTVPTVIPADAKDAVHSCIKSAWAGNDSVVLLSKVGPHKLFYQDILKFGPRKELESEVINAYLMLKVRQHNLTSPEKAFHMNTFAITAMWNGKYQGLKVNPANYDVIVGIVNECHHWFLVQNTNTDFSNAPQDVAQFRMETASTLLEQSDDLCHFCGEAETFDDSAEVLWISCDYCGRRFHMGCVNNPSTEKTIEMLLLQ